MIRPEAEFLTLETLNHKAETEIKDIFLFLVDKYEEQLRKFGIHCARPSTNFKQNFDQLSQDKKLQALNDLLLTYKIINELDTSMTKNVSLGSEIDFLRLALNSLELNLGDENFLNKIKEGDVLEIYNSNGVQIYRSFTYFKFCGYSIADLLVSSWDELWERPRGVMTKLMALAPKLFVPGCKTIKYDLPPYVVRETLIDRDRDLMFYMKYATPVLDISSQVPTGFLTTGRLELIPRKEKYADVWIL